MTTKRTSQKRRVLSAFSTPKTMLEVSVETGILRANICRYIAQFQRDNKIELNYYGLCPVSKYRAGFYLAV